MVTSTSIFLLIKYTFYVTVTVTKLKFTFFILFRLSDVRCNHLWWYPLLELAALGVEINIYLTLLLHAKHSIENHVICLTHWPPFAAAINVAEQNYCACAENTARTKRVSVLMIVCFGFANKHLSHTVVTCKTQHQEGHRRQRRKKESIQAAINWTEANLTFAMGCVWWDATEK